MARKNKSTMINPPDVTVVNVSNGTNGATAPLAQETVPAGFPSPADDYLESSLDLNEHLVKHPAATFFVRVSGDSMIGAGIHPGDMLVVDRSLEARDGKVIIARFGGELTVKRMRRKSGKLFLTPENTRYEPMEVTPDTDFEVWGVVTAVIHMV